MHSNDDLRLIANEAKNHVGDGTKNMIEDVIKNFDDHDTLRQMERVSKLRWDLNKNHIDRGNTRKLKDILFLDIVLENLLRAYTEKIMHINIGFEQYIREISIIISNLVLSYQWSELSFLKDDWDKIVQANSKDNTEDNARKIKSVLDRVK
jgi:alpha-glucan,water dikinase